MIWNKTKECMSRDEMHKLQGRRLQTTVRRVYHNVPFYRAKMQELGVEPGDVRGIEDIVKLPFTTKQDLRDNYPFGLSPISSSEYVRVHASSGTTGKPTAVPHSRKDLEVFSECVARALCCTGATKDDVVQVAYGYGLFTGGLGLHDGATKLGATVIPVSAGNTRNQITMLQDFGSTVLACTPSYALFIAEALAEAGVDPSTLPLRVGVFGAEPWSAEMRAKIEEKLKIQAYDIYGLSEIMGPGISDSCQFQDGLHIAEDHFYPEILSPDTLEPVSPGVTGELTFTHLTKEAMPLLRYRTRDLTSLNYKPCPCGRTNVRMARVMGRSDDMLIIRGVNVFPSQIESVLMEIPEAKPYYMIIVDRKGALDTLEIQVEVDDKYFSDEIAQMDSIRGKIKHRLDNALRIGVIVSLVEHKTLQRSEGKAKRVTDRRKI
ncbi:MAG: phenylacetate--CoA ligase [Clostridiales Family XIII bacterium]|jgi:phenylacetate-CoA ligase|nr:phenylacetate--CoA ligase [Clostridiales Family XIII bacterium]